jgi:putative two-component system response regulator
MPDMNGYDVCRALKSDPHTAEIPVIFVTTWSEVGDEATGFAVGAVDYIVKPVSPPIVLARVSTHLSLVQATLLKQSYHDAISMLGEAGHYNDTDTGSHIWRMAAYAGALARAAGWSEDACEQLMFAAPMHDTGKIGIPNAILRKVGQLDSDEWTVMMTHAKIGHSILTKSRSPLFQIAAEIALRHHEKFDGSGYPDQLVGEQIPESARIVAIADVFDALASKRPYKEAWTLDRVFKTLQERAGSHLDSRLVDIFISIMPEILAIKAGWERQDATLAIQALPGSGPELRVSS